MKKVLLSLLILLWAIFSFTYAVPSLSQNKLNNIWYNLDGTVSRTASLKDNIRNLFFPNAWRNWGAIWNKIITISVWVLFIFLIWAGSLFVMNADDEWELKKAKLNILYIFYGAFLIFWAVWILWSILHVWWETDAGGAVVWVQKSILGTLLLFFKSLAYYLAFIMMVYYGYKIMHAQEKADKIKAWRNGALNIIIAIVAIKVLDYVYYIAQTWNFKSWAWNLLSWTWKVLWWILWVVLVLAILYAAVLLFVSRWNEEFWKKAKIIIRNVFLVVFVLFLFIVIIYDVIKNFSG